MDTKIHGQGKPTHSKNDNRNQIHYYEAKEYSEHELESNHDYQKCQSSESLGRSKVAPKQNLLSSLASKLATIIVG